MARAQPATSTDITRTWSGTDITGTLRRTLRQVSSPRTTGSTVCLSACRARPSRRRFAEMSRVAFIQVLAANSPHLSDDVSRARLVGRLRGFAGLPGHLRQSHGPGWALVGDAGYFKDPLTAHGITDALRDAELLARAILDGRRARGLSAPARRPVGAAVPRTEAIASFRWNLDEVKTLHASLSASMRAECEYMAGLPVPVRREPQIRSATSDRNAALTSEAC